MKNRLDIFLFFECIMIILVKHYINDMKKIICTILTTATIFSIPACLTMRKSDQKIIKQLAKNGFEGQVLTYSFENKTMRYVISKPLDKDLTTILFIHGAPGSSTDFEDYLHDYELNQKANLISIDRLGYGYSDFGKPQTSIQKQGESIEVLIDRINTPIILVGWSFGGPIAGQIALNKKDKIKHVIMLAPAISPKDERYFSIGKIAQKKLTKWLVPTPFIIAQEEKMKHEEELNRLQNEWHKLKTPILYLHGSNDKLVPYTGNINFAKKVFDKHYLQTKTIEGYGHIFPITNKKVVKDELLSILSSKNSL